MGTAEKILLMIRITLQRQEKMILFHIAAIGWISPQTGYKILNHIVKTKIGNLKATVTSKMTLYNQIKT